MRLTVLRLEPTARRTPDANNLGVMNRDRDALVTWADKVCGAVGEPFKDGKRPTWTFWPAQSARWVFLSAGQPDTIRPEARKALERVFPAFGANASRLDRLVNWLKPGTCPSPDS